MDNWIQKWRAREEIFFNIMNERRHGRKRYRIINQWLSFITHTGGASFTLAASLVIALIANKQWSTAGWHSFLAVILSHIPVFLIKRFFKRLRPYQSLEKVFTGNKLLKDPSFPSGHTTASFAFLTPLALGSGAVAFIVWPITLVIGLSVAWSRMYLGLHYPSDVIVGMFIGSITGLCVSLLAGPFPF
ncbi:phosphatase PAP2 family protein [Paenibacillus yanchengensis]|uniref:Phosphatase PAP2 family protein n=1 Tax=Paenibacillus yanchengensis TaxID=2035833 RepID=A0ABW4YFJ7_9BACL